MAVVESLNEHRVCSRPTLECRPVDHISLHTPDEVRAAFQFSAKCALDQAWESERSKSFTPATVHVAWSDDELLIYAELVDADIGTAASGPNQRLWELGDAFEIFLCPDGQESYVELQVAPNNQRLQLRYENRAALDYARKHNDLKAALLPGDAFRSKVWVSGDRWQVFAGIPASLVSGGHTRLSGSCWRFSFSRYDYTRGNPEPVISSSSPHARADFHCKQDWGFLNFKVS